MPMLKKIFDGTSQLIPLSQGTTRIGRSSKNHLKVPLPVVSKIHAILEFDGTSCTVENKGTNGTFVNGQLLTQVASLHHGDEIRVGTAILVFLENEPPEALSAVGSARPILQVVSENSKCPEESIRRLYVKLGDVAERIAIEQTGSISEDRIRACIRLSEQSLSTLASRDAVRIVSQILRFSEALRNYVDDQDVDHLLAALHLLFPKATEIAIMTEIQGDAQKFKIIGASCRDGSEFAVVCGDVLHRTVSRCECLLVADLWRDASAEKPVLSKMGRISLICVPIRFGDGRCFGAIQMIAPSPKPEFEIGDLERLAILAQLLTIVLPNS